MDRLDARRDPRRGESCAIRRMEHLDVLDPGHQRETATDRCQEVQRLADRRVTDGMDLGRDPAGRRTTDEFAQDVRVGHPESAACVGRHRAVGFRFEVLQEPRRARPHRAVGEALQPADPCPAGGVRAQDVTAAQAAGERRVEAVVAQARVDAQRQPPPIGQVRVRRVRERQVRVRDDRPWIVDGDEPHRDQLPSDRRDGRRQVRGLGVGDVDGHDPRRRVEDDPLGRAVGGPPDDAARRILGRGRDPGRPQRGVADPEGMVVVRPQRHTPSGRHGLEVVGRRPAAPPIRVPAVALEPGVRIGREVTLVRGPDPAQAVGDRRTRGQVEMPGREGQLGEMQVRVGQPGDRHLVGLEIEPLRVRVRPGLEVHLGPGEGDPTSRGSRWPPPSRSRHRRPGSRCVR